MSSYFGGVWSSLKFNSVNVLAPSGAGFDVRFAGKSSDLEFKNPRYKSVGVHIAKQFAMSMLEGELNKLVPKFQRHMEKKMRDFVLKQQQTNLEELISDQMEQSESYGRITTVEGSHQIVAQDAYGHRVPEALMVYYDLPEGQTVHVTTIAGNESWADDERDDKFTTEFDTRTLCHIDLAPQVSMNSTKNIVMTQVQGRDFTRKELVSGGDLTFTINGSIVSNQPGVYPEAAVQKFIQMMKYNGILNVHFLMFNQFNVKRIIVKDFSLGTIEYKNIQPYSFSCVAVEPDEDVKVLKDTIVTLNKELELSPMNKWYKLLLENKLAQMVANTAVNTATSAAVQGAGMGLDALVPNI